MPVTTMSSGDADESLACDVAAGSTCALAAGVVAEAAPAVPVPAFAAVGEVWSVCSTDCAWATPVTLAMQSAPTEAPRRRRTSDAAVECDGAVGRMMILPNEPRGFESAGLLLYLSEQSGDPTAMVAVTPVPAPLHFMSLV